MKVLLSGPNGNLGSQIKKHAQFEILPIHREEWESFTRMDLYEVDFFIHCAYDLKNLVQENPSKVLDSNVLSTMKALEICKKNKIKNFLFLSSCSVYGHSSKTTEDTICNPVTINGLTKLLNEKIILSFCMENEINPIILRAFNSYGGKDEFSIISKLIDSYKKDKTFKLFNDGFAERDFIHVSDIAKVVCQLCLTPPTTSILNIGTGEAIRIIDVVKCFERKFGNLKIEKLSSIDEAIYSRADIRKLKAEVDIDFVNVFDFIESL
ncbi:MAG: SDR family oxidoreductase [Bacteriovoracaceae bacterium]|nr:SDR family oxidoreductase [Bacteriovoracaceae bacterium]